MTSIRPLPRHSLTCSTRYEKCCQPRPPAPTRHNHTPPRACSTRCSARLLLSWGPTVNVWCTVQGYADQVGLSHIKPHDVRRCVGMQLATRDIRKAQKALGHKRIDTTAQHYVLDELEEGLTDDLH